MKTPSSNQLARVAVLSGARTPIGAFGGVFKNIPAYELAATAIRAALGEASLAPADIGEVVLGNVLQAGQGPNAARRAAAQAGIPFEVPAMTLNKVCGSGISPSRPMLFASEESTSPSLGEWNQ